MVSSCGKHRETRQCDKAGGCSSMTSARGGSAITWAIAEECMPMRMSTSAKSAICSTPDFKLEFLYMTRFRPHHLRRAASSSPQFSILLLACPPVAGYVGSRRLSSFIVSGRWRLSGMPKRSLTYLAKREVNGHELKFQKSRLSRSRDAGEVVGPSDMLRARRGIKRLKYLRCFCDVLLSMRMSGVLSCLASSAKIGSRRPLRKCAKTGLCSAYAVVPVTSTI
eukprot:3501178-Prymnesium_polylepis.1